MRRSAVLKLAAEAVSVVFAVLVALAIDEWWEERENADMARVSLDAIVREIRENREQLTNTGDMAPLSEMLTSLDTVIATFERGEKPEGASIGYDLALLSSAAWETAQLNRTTQFLPLDRVVGIARLYEFQRYYERAQDELFDAITGIRGGSDAADEMRTFRSRLTTTIGLRRQLARTYACNLVAIEGPEAPESEACPEALDDAEAPGDGEPPG